MPGTSLNQDLRTGEVTPYDPDCWVFDVDGCLVDSLTGTSLRPGAREILEHLAGRTRVFLWSAGGDDYAQDRAEQFGVDHLVSGYFSKEGRDADPARYLERPHLPACRRHRPSSSTTAPKTWPPTSKSSPSRPTWPRTATIGASSRWPDGPGSPDRPGDRGTLFCGRIRRSVRSRCVRRRARRPGPTAAADGGRRWWSRRTRADAVRRQPDAAGKADRPARARQEAEGRSPARRSACPPPAMTVSVKSGGKLDAGPYARAVEIAAVVASRGGRALARRCARGERGAPSPDPAWCRTRRGHRRRRSPALAVHDSTPGDASVRGGQGERFDEFVEHQRAERISDAPVGFL